MREQDTSSVAVRRLGGSVVAVGVSCLALRGESVIVVTIGSYISVAVVVVV